MDWNAATERLELNAGETFRLTSVSDIFRKLSRELKRLKAATTLYDMTDAAVNFAVTAWHMSDWIMVRHADRMAAIEIRSARALQQYVSNKCLALAVCDVMANATKHGGLAREQEGRPKIETFLIYGRGPVTEGVVVAAMMDKDRSLGIRVNGSNRYAIDLLNEAMMFWYEFTQKHCLGPPAQPDAV